MSNKNYIWLIQIIIYREKPLLCGLNGMEISETQKKSVQVFPVILTDQLTRQVGTLQNLFNPLKQ